MACAQLGGEPEAFRRCGPPPQGTAPVADDAGLSSIAKSTEEAAKPFAAGKEEGDDGGSAYMGAAQWFDPRRSFRWQLLDVLQGELLRNHAEERRRAAAIEDPDDREVAELTRRRRRLGAATLVGQLTRVGIVPVQLAHRVLCKLLQGWESIGKEEDAAKVRVIAATKAAGVAVAGCLDFLGAARPAPEEEESEAPHAAQWRKKRDFEAEVDEEVGENTEKLESVVRVLRSAGQVLDGASNAASKELVDRYMAVCHRIAKRSGGIEMRVKFMLQALAEARAEDWQPKSGMFAVAQSNKSIREVQLEDHIELIAGSDEKMAEMLRREALAQANGFGEQDGWEMGGDKKERRKREQLRKAAKKAQAARAQLASGQAPGAPPPRDVRRPGDWAGGNRRGGGGGASTAPGAFSSSRPPAQSRAAGGAGAAPAAFGASSSSGAGSATAAAAAAAPSSASAGGSARGAAAASGGASAGPDKPTFRRKCRGMLEEWEATGGRYRKELREGAHEAAFDHLGADGAAGGEGAFLADRDTAEQQLVACTLVELMESRRGPDLAEPAAEMLACLTGVGAADAGAGVVKPANAVAGAVLALSVLRDVCMDAPRAPKVLGVCLGHAVALGAFGPGSLAALEGAAGAHEGAKAACGSPFGKRVAAAMVDAAASGMGGSPSDGLWGASG